MSDRSEQVEARSVTKFVFSDNARGDSIDLSIQQVVSEDYGFYIWPSSKVLAEYVWHNRNLFANKAVLELGAGTCLPGLVAAACGSKVYLTDREDVPEVLQNCKQNVLTNNPVAFTTNFVNKRPVFLNATVLGLPWGKFSPSVLSTISKLDYILGADCFYDNTEAYQDILATVSYFMRVSPGLKFITAYQERNAQRTIQPLLRKWKMKACPVPLDLFFSRVKYQLAETVHVIEVELDQ